MKYRVFLSAFFIFFTFSAAQAEYRVFVLKISKKVSPNRNPNTAAAPTANNAVTEAPETTEAAPAFRLVTSTLDPEQYRYYYPVAPDEEVTYIDTWRCYGRTDNFQPFCPNPKDQIAPEANPAP